MREGEFLICMTAQSVPHGLFRLNDSTTNKGDIRKQVFDISEFVSMINSLGK